MSQSALASPEMSATTARANKKPRIPTRMHVLLSNDDRDPKTYRRAAGRLADGDRPLQGRITGIAVIVEPAGPSDREAAGLPRLPGLQQSHLVDRRAVRVGRMWIGLDVVRR